ncbi:2-dehydropantoate 2-reductase [Shewanella sp. SR44-4]|jgi:2-dehydropantoate 2-reductase|uniref:ketopantoate reductase family protein n=1 Tax=Shewanella sp. SR44-4 TaxID=2760935 RepID=UPI0015FF8F22|nr:2-dehydropantoate 2-reductase [Shewanella sp. SR44-4]MBB1362737.1 2-dehydropantoate 2-reductase [Shewanella sp. SR44-4]
MVKTSALPASSTHDNNALIAVLGAGAIGQLMYHKLSVNTQEAQVNEVMLIGRDKQTRHQQLRFIDHTQHTHEALATILGTDDNRLARVELLFVCVKAYQVEQALLPLLPKLSPQCHIVLLHNGLGPHLPVAAALMRYKDMGLTLGTTSQAALKLSPWQVKYSGLGVTQLGHYCGSAMSTALKMRISRLHSDNQPIEWHQPVLPVLWQKLAINAVINPLTVLNQCANGQLAATEYQSQISAIIDELVEVAKYDGIILDKAAVKARVYQVIELTSANFSSMYQDVAHSRPTEINEINGYICQQAKALHLNVPNNQYLVDKVLQLSKS